jgi:hypothetical protein
MSRAATVAVAGGAVDGLNANFACRPRRGVYTCWSKGGENTIDLRPVNLRD